jgi:hypothetical protein
VDELTAWTRRASLRSADCRNVAAEAHERASALMAEVARLEQSRGNRARARQIYVWSALAAERAERTRLSVRVYRGAGQRQAAADRLGATVAEDPPQS